MKVIYEKTIRDLLDEAIRESYTTGKTIMWFELTPKELFELARIEVKPHDKDRVYIYDGYVVKCAK